MENFRQRLLDYIKSLIQYTKVYDKRIVISKLIESMPFADIISEEESDLICNITINLESKYTFKLLWDKNNQYYWLKEIK